MTRSEYSILLIDHVLVVMMAIIIVIDFCFIGINLKLISYNVLRNIERNWSKEF